MIWEEELEEEMGSRGTEGSEVDGRWQWDNIQNWLTYVFSEKKHPERLNVKITAFVHMKTSQLTFKQGPNCDSVPNFLFHLLDIL